MPTKCSLETNTVELSVRDEDGKSTDKKEKVPIYLIDLTMWLTIYVRLLAERGDGEEAKASHLGKEGNARHAPPCTLGWLR